MRYVSAFTVFALLVAVSSAQEKDECMPPKPTPGQKPNHTHHGDCCDVTNLVSNPYLGKAMQTCHQKVPRPPKPTGPPPAGAAGPPPEARNHVACMEECIFGELGSLTADKQLDTAMIDKKFVSEDPDFGPVLKSSVAKCLTSYKNNIDQSLECKSGANEFNMCMMREAFLNCPTAKWTASTECAELKAKTIKCPKMPVHLGKKPPRPNGPPN